MIGTTLASELVHALTIGPALGEAIAAPPSVGSNRLTRSVRVDSGSAGSALPDLPTLPKSRPRRSVRGKVPPAPARSEPLPPPSRVLTDSELSRLDRMFDGHEPVGVLVGLLLGVALGVDLAGLDDVGIVAGVLGAGAAVVPGSGVTTGSGTPM